MEQQDYRMSNITKINKFFENEYETRSRLYNNYKKAYNILYGVNTVTSLISLSTGITGIALLPIPFATMFLEGVAIGSGFIAAVTSIGNKRILKKLEKHEKIMTVALSKLSSISNIVSKALADSTIDETEFEMVVQECEKYVELKYAIKNKTRHELNKFSKNMKQESENII